MRTLPRLLLWWLLFGACVFCWIVLLEHGLGGLAKGFLTEFRALQSWLGGQ